MPMMRGFVERLEIGRAGLVVAGLLHDDGTRADYQIPDLDADPERFNERLSKLGLLRDAMTRAEPVEVEFVLQNGLNVIERVRRITRDNLSPTAETQTVQVMVAGVAVVAENRTGPNAEVSDVASVVTLAPDGTVQRYVLDLQIPERAVTESQLDMIRVAQSSGASLSLTVDSKTLRIIAVEIGTGGVGTGGGEEVIVDGFVESIEHQPFTGGFGATVGFTTAPPFSGAGNVVSLIPFEPELRQFLVVPGSPEYRLFLAGLRDKLRMRVRAGVIARTPPRDDIDRRDDARSVASTPGLLDRNPNTAVDGVGRTGADAAVTLVRGAELLACLASASRPVWIQVSRKSLDVGPDAPCTEGLPSSDLSPQSLRDLQLPYTAEWLGLGCFNHGVYRFQFALDIPFEVLVDGKTLCVHSSEDGETQFAHACLDGEHEVRVVLTNWTCRKTFRMDVYRIR